MSRRGIEDGMPSTSVSQQSRVSSNEPDELFYTEGSLINSNTLPKMI
jgi:hypothetical protein